MNEITVLMLLIVAGLLVRVFFNSVLKRASLFERGLKLAVNTVYYLLIPLAFIKIYIDRGVAASDAWISLSILLLVFTVAFTLKLITAGRPREYYRALFLVSAFPNSVFLGFPVSMALFGVVDVAATYGVVTLVLNVVVPDAMSMGRVSLRRVLLMPALLGFTLGLISHYTLPAWLSQRVSSLLWWAPRLLSYVATAVLGARLPLRLSVLHEEWGFIAVASLYRFLIAPLLSLIVVSATRVDWFYGVQLIVVSAMPPAVMNTLIAERYGWLPELVASTTFILTIIVVLCFPLITTIL
ncbi:MAG: transporter [Desulfurococcus sp.]|nr:transporter [Desulfurococcus sp.]